MYELFSTLARNISKKTTKNIDGGGVKIGKLHLYSPILEYHTS